MAEEIAVVETQIDEVREKIEEVKEECRDEISPKKVNLLREFLTKLETKLTSLEAKLEAMESKLLTPIPPISSTPQQNPPSDGVDPKEAQTSRKQEPEAAPLPSAPPAAKPRFRKL